MNDTRDPLAFIDEAVAKITPADVRKRLNETLRQAGYQPTEPDSTPGPAAFSCPCCGAVSPHPADAANGYCARCHWWTGDPELGPAHLAGPCPSRTQGPPGGTSQSSGDQW